MQQFSVPKIYKGVHVDKGCSHAAVDMPEMHAHSFHELYFLLSGERRYFVGHKIFDVLPGNLVIIPQTVLHRTTAPNKQGYERYVVYFQESFIQDLIHSIGLDNFNAFLDGGCIQFTEKDAITLKEMLVRLATEAKKADVFTPAMEKNLLEQIILHTLRYGKKKALEQKEGADKIQIATRYISEHYDEEITLSNAAAMAFMEETYFSKKFKQLTGFGFKEFLITTRINAAEKLLQTTDMSVSEIAEACGFSSSNYFGNVFKRVMGVSPANYHKHD